MGGIAGQCRTVGEWLAVYVGPTGHLIVGSYWVSRVKWPLLALILLILSPFTKVMVNTFASIPHKWSCRWWYGFVGEWDTVLVHPAHKPVIVLVGGGQTDVSVAGYHFVDSGTVDQRDGEFQLGPVGK